MIGFRVSVLLAACFANSSEASLVCDENMAGVDVKDPHCIGKYVQPGLTGQNQSFGDSVATSLPTTVHLYRRSPMDPQKSPPDPSVPKDRVGEADGKAKKGKQSPYEMAKKQWLLLKIEKHHEHRPAKAKFYKDKLDELNGISKTPAEEGATKVVQQGKGEESTSQKQDLGDKGATSLPTTGHLYKRSPMDPYEPKPHPKQPSDKVKAILKAIQAKEPSAESMQQQREALVSAVEQFKNVPMKGDFFKEQLAKFDKANPATTSHGATKQGKGKASVSPDPDESPEMHLASSTDTKATGLKKRSSPDPPKPSLKTTESEQIYTKSKEKMFDRKWPRPDTMQPNHYRIRQLAHRYRLNDRYGPFYQKIYNKARDSTSTRLADGISTQDGEQRIESEPVPAKSGLGRMKEQDSN